MPSPELLEVLILAPIGRDGRLAADTLHAGGLPARPCTSMTDVCETLGRNPAGVGALVLAADTLASAAECAFLSDWLGRQDAWSDLPIVALADDDEEGIALGQLLDVLKGCGAVSVLERPMQRAALVTAVRAALRLRKHQLQVRDLLEELNRASRAKDDFLAVLSHEMRTPLTAIAGWVDLLGMSPEDPVLQRKAREAIERNVQAQTRIVSDLLDASRIVARKLELEIGPVDLEAVVQEAVQDLQPMAQAKGLTITVSHAPQGILSLGGDAERLQQVVWNLVCNAVKFTPSGGGIEVITQADSSWAEVRVTDTGTGLAPEMIRRVFDRFFQVDASTSRSQDGLGLGLAIVRSLVELHGGTVDAESPGLGRGSTFVVRLPLPDNPASRRLPAAPDVFRQE